jgi:hypothetical protein
MVIGTSVSIRNPGRLQRPGFLLWRVQRNAVRPVKFETLGISPDQMIAKMGKKRQCATISIVFRRNRAVLCAIKLALSGVSCVFGQAGVRGPAAR